MSKAWNTRTHINTVFIDKAEKKHPQICLESYVPFRFLRHLPNGIANNLIAFLKLDVVIGERQAAFDSFLHRLDIVAHMLQRRQGIYARRTRARSNERQRERVTYLDGSLDHCESI